jgi:hypothetical protein
MYARLDDMAAARASMRKEHALKLRVVQHKYADQIAAHARALERHERKLQRLHAKINAEAIARDSQAPTLPTITPLDSTNANPLRRIRSTMRVAALWKALESSTSSKWPAPWPITLISWPRA